MTTDAVMKKHLYETRETLAEAMALAISGLLAGGIATRGNAVLAVSGGSTPKLFFKTLSQVELDWSQVTIVLVDERIVPVDNDRSNAKLVRDHLMCGLAAKANLIAYSVGENSPEQCASASTALLNGFVDQIDALILGMGTDGHTASFFPGGDRLDDALDLKGDQTVLPMQAQGAGEPRLTLTLPVILAARFIALHIEGDEKMQVLKNAQAGTDQNEIPVRAVLNNAPSPINLFWAP